MISRTACVLDNTPGAACWHLLLALLAASIMQTASASDTDRVAEGKALTMERSKGNCLACHIIDDGELPGNLGPPLLAMQVRFPNREALVEQICDATKRNPDSRMPPVPG